jgi:hypothetical protein
MAEFSAALTKPNGLVPQFGDNDSGRMHKLNPDLDRDPRDHRHVVALIGRLLDRTDLLEAAASDLQEAELIAGGLTLGIMTTPSWSTESQAIIFPKAGIAVIRQRDAFLAVICGPNGHGRRGGHGHNDKLSFELNVDGEDVIVDGGSPVYSSDPIMRNTYRSTGAHSTVAVSGREQDKWSDGLDGLFKLAERSGPELWIDESGAIVGRHYGYGKPHGRRFQLSAGALVIADKLALTAERRVVFNFDPSIHCRLRVRDGNAVRCELRDGAGLCLQVTVAGGGQPAIGAGRFSRGFGVPVETSNFSVVMQGDVISTRIEWGVK